ncbi:MAG: hypothetical protein Q9184_006071 [Pyrenodesmia sp. 2 TL-2023]
MPSLSSRGSQALKLLKYRPYVEDIPDEDDALGEGNGFEEKDPGHNTTGPEAMAGAQVDDQDVATDVSNGLGAPVGGGINGGPMRRTSLFQRNATTTSETSPSTPV